MLYEVVLQGDYFGQQTINRWNYISGTENTPPLGSVGLVGAMGLVWDEVLSTFATGGIGDLLKAQLQSNFRFVSTIAKAIYDPLDFYETIYPGGVVGDVVSSDAQSPVLAFGLYTSRVRLDIARGMKRFAGAPEAATMTGGVLDPGTVAGLQDIGDEMAAVLTFDPGGGSIAYTPCIVKKEKYTAPSGNDAYRYYASQATQLLNVATGFTWTPYNQIRTQNSRQYGHGG